MADAVEITGIPTKAKARQVANTMKAFYPGWDVVIIGNSAPYTARRTPRGDNVASRAAVDVDAGDTTAPSVAVLDTTAAGDVRDGAYGFLDFIAQYESLGNYNAYFAHARNVDDPRFTSMTIDEVLAWQQGRKYSACGKYQIIRATLIGLKAQLGLAGTELYDPERQDALAFTLLQRRGLKEFLAGRVSTEDFALSVAREWAALPGVKPPHGERSVYAGDDVNHALVNRATYLAAIAKMKESHRIVASA
ncbi:MAG TPA: hypothetical protein VFJ13_10935 [Paracoccaceae bacterium]|nr:hypothetical protein [Paracoccaceae bacterium]